MYDAFYIVNNQNTFKNGMEVRLNDLLRLLKNGQKSDSFVGHLEHHFNATMSHTYLRKHMTFKEVKHLNLLGAMEKFTTQDSNVCMEKPLKYLKIYVINVSQL